MYKFHIVGYSGIGKNDLGYNESEPVDVTVYSDSYDSAIEKAEKIAGCYISIAQRKVTIEECNEI